jgi:hypothetical protein
LIRRVKRHDGTVLAHPIFWGRVLASSASVAITRYLNAANLGDNRSHFDAIPGKR